MFDPPGATSRSLPVARIIQSGCEITSTSTVKVCSSRPSDDNSNSIDAIVPFHASSGIVRANSMVSLWLTSRVPLSPSPISQSILVSLPAIVSVRLEETSRLSSKFPIFSTIRVRDVEVPGVVNTLPPDSTVLSLSNRLTFHRWSWRASISMTAVSTTELSPCERNENSTNMPWRAGVSCGRVIWIGT